MPTLSLFDTIPLSGTKKVRDGYMVSDARVSRVGMQMYLGSELGRDDLPLVRVYRPEETVFAQDALASLTHLPVTNDHPPENVTSKNWRQYSVGHTGEHITKDGGFVRVPMMLLDQAAIDDVVAGKKELSLGYTSNIEFVDGVTPDGEVYDAIMKDIRGNHLAIVKKGRAGGDCRIGDYDSTQVQPKSPTTAEKGTPPMHKLTIDGVTVELSDTAREVVSKVLVIADARKAELEATTAAHATAIALKDGELAKKDAEIEGLKARVLDGAALDAAVAGRTALLANARAIAPELVLDGKSDADIKKMVVASKIKDGATVLADKSPAYIEARFDGLVENLGSQTADPFRRAVADSLPLAVHDAADVAYLKMIADQEAAWKLPQGNA